VHASSVLDTISFRPATPADLAAIVSQRIDSLLEMGILEAGGSTPELDARFHDEFAALIASADFISALAVTSEGEVVGCAYGLISRRLPYPVSSVQGELAGVYVVPAMRMRGVASRLVRRIVSALESRGVREIVLRPRRLDAALYTRVGFRAASLMKRAP
jgi:N-acetylglutamate synthase-like GNAT family acetyltransferase